MDILLDENKILYGIMDLSNRIYEDYKNRNPLFICVLKGASRFFHELTSMLSSRMDLDYDFIMVQSYDGNKSTKDIELICDVDKNIVKNREIILIDDIYDTGLTVHWLIDHFINDFEIKNIDTCVLINKSKEHECDIKIDYDVFKIKDEFIIGYGMDYNGKYRGLPYIGVLDENHKR